MTTPSALLPTKPSPAIMLTGPETLNLERALAEARTRHFGGTIVEFYETRIEKFVWIREWGAERQSVVFNLTTGFECQE